MESFSINNRELNKRFDPFFYKLYFRDKMNELKASQHQIVSLSEICTKITDGTHFTPKYVEDGIPFLSVKDVRENHISFENTKFISLKEHKDLIKRCKPEPNDILLTKVGTVGIAAVIPEDSPEFSIFVSVALIKINLQKATPHYVAAYLNSNLTKFQIERVVKGIGVPDFHLEDIEKIKIPLPPIRKQEELAKHVQKASDLEKHKNSEVYALIDLIYEHALKELNLNYDLKIRKSFSIFSNELNNRLDPLFYTIPVYDFLRTCNCETKTIGEVTQYLKTGFAAGKSDQDLTGKGIVQIRPTNMSETRELVFERNVYIEKNQLKKRKSDVLMKSEVLFNNTNSQEQVGKTCVFDLDGSFFCSNHITRIKAKEDLMLPEYLALILNIYQKQYIFYRICTNWNNQSGVNATLLSSLIIPLPNLKNQGIIVADYTTKTKKIKKIKLDVENNIKQAKLYLERTILES